MKGVYGYSEGSSSACASSSDRVTSTVTVVVDVVPPSGSSVSSVTDVAEYFSLAFRKT